MKQMIMILATLLVIGCSSGNPSMTDLDEMRTKCIGGVVYYLYTETAGYGGFGFMSPKYNRDGSVALCEL